jgi:orotate phosphoribosyltransferase
VDPADVLDLFRRHGALLEGHFRLSSGLHAGQYLQCAVVLQHPAAAAALGSALAARIAAVRPSVVISPALGGIIIGHEVARALGSRFLFAERQDGVLSLRRGFVVEAGERAVVVEDVLTTGTSTRETMQIVRAARGEVGAVGAIIDRRVAGADLGVRFESLARVELPTWEPSACPLCQAGLPVVKPGSRPGGDG